MLLSMKKEIKFEIRIKFDNESEDRYFQQISSCYFIEYYKIAEDEEEEKCIEEKE